MGVIFASNEYEDFDVIGTLSYTPAYHRSSYARASMNIESGSIGFAIPQQSQFYLQARMQSTTTAVSSISGKYHFGVSSTEFPFRLGWAYTSLTSLQYPQLEVWNGSSYVSTAVSPLNTVLNQVSKYTFFIKGGVSGEFKLWVDNVLHIDYAGDLSGGYEGDISYFKFNNTSVFSYNLSEIIAHTSDPRDMSVKTIVPTGAGTYSDWTGTYANIDEVNLDVGDFISSNTADQRSTFAMSNLPEGDLHVKWLGVTAKASKGETGPQNMKLTIRTNGSDYDGESHSLPSTMTTVRLVMPVNPVTGVAWSREDIDALEAGVLSVE